MINHKKVCLCINGAQPVRLEKRTIELKNLFKQILVPFKIYSDFECILNNAESYEGSSSKNYQGHIPCSFAYKLVCVGDKFTKPTVIYRRKNAAYRFIEAILEEYKYCKNVMKKHFKKNLILTEEEEKFQSSNICWICEKLIEYEKVRDLCHITGKFMNSSFEKQVKKISRE